MTCDCGCRFDPMDQFGCSVLTCPRCGKVFV